MASRNERCPCGSGTKYKRCCLVKHDAITRELRERDAMLGQLIDWVEVEHEQTVEDAEAETTVIRLLRGPPGRSASLVWAVNDFLPADGGPPLTDRFAELPDLAPLTRDIARGLAAARLRVYRVGSVLDRIWVEIEPLDGGTPATRIAARDGLNALAPGDILVARVVPATTVPTTWGACFRFDAESERRWQAKLAALPSEPAQAALAVLGFHPDDAAEPLPGGLELHAAAWRIDDREAVLEAIEDDDAWECLGEAIPAGWAFAWLGDATSSGVDLGGWQEEDGAIEVARLVVLERELRLVSADRGTLIIVAAYVEEDLRDLIQTRPDTLAA
jgi:hypothetical protein